MNTSISAARTGRGTKFDMRVSLTYADEIYKTCSMSRAAPSQISNFHSVSTAIYGSRPCSELIVRNC